LLSTELLHPPVLCGGHQETLTCLAWSPDGALLASADAAGVVQVWDVATGQVHATYQEPRHIPACALAWSPDGTQIAVGGQHERVRLLDARTATEVASFALVFPGRRPGGWGPAYRFKSIEALAFSPDGRFLLGGGQAGGERLHLWEVSTGLKRPLPAEGQHVQTVSLVTHWAAFCIQSC
jgi:WD40 repeat protein